MRAIWLARVAVASRTPPRRHYSVKEVAASRRGQPKPLVACRRRKSCSAGAPAIKSIRTRVEVDRCYVQYVRLATKGKVPLCVAWRRSRA